MSIGPRDDNPKRNLPNHSDTNGPGRISNGESKVGIIGALVFSFLHIMHNLSNTGQHVGRERLQNGLERGHKREAELLTLERRFLNSGFRYSADWT